MTYHPEHHRAPGWLLAAVGVVLALLLALTLWSSFRVGRTRTELAPEPAIPAAPGAPGGGGPGAGGAGAAPPGGGP